MRCYICDTELDEIKLDADNKVEPCSTCQEVITDTLLDFEPPEDGDF